MDDMTAFERQLSGEFEDLMGPVRPVDDLAVLDAVFAEKRSQRWGFTMLSALKFVTAGVIVALFGGFLLTSVLTSPQSDEMEPAGVTASPAPVTAEESLSGMVAEEVEPGVFRVVNDGVRDLMPAHYLLVGDDGSVWGSRDSPVLGGGTFRLGGEFIEEEWPTFVTLDGTFWAGLRTYDGAEWSALPEPPTEPDAFELYDLGGTIWATWPDPQRPWQSVVARLDGGEWRLLDAPLEHFADDEFSSVELLTTNGDDLWAWTQGVSIGGSGEMLRWDDGEWRRVFGSHDGRAGEPLGTSLLALGRDGTSWFTHGEFDDDEPDGIYFGLAAFDGSERKEWRLDGLRAPTEGGVGGIGVAPDESLWVSIGETFPEVIGEDVEADVSPTCHGLARFDGERWDRYLVDLCTQDASMGPDGSVWTLAGVGGYLATDPDPEGNHEWWDLYVITPGAVAATE